MSRSGSLAAQCDHAHLATSFILHLYENINISRFANFANWPILCETSLSISMFKKTINTGSWRQSASLACRGAQCVMNYCLFWLNCN